MARNMQTVSAPKDKGIDLTITIRPVGFGRGMPVPPSRKHKDKIKAGRKSACRNKGCKQREDW